ncbi:hypothetical protein FOZ62_003610 [Perkinsus olseni]|uniref:Uncharacterized protein n=1 Tax=Perkinsus olseni TaxID=32597 RepID=A0A7J6UF83_PEROL|nr:hypothetical protein FOZ62_003610 [Perkinsus olseni]
MALSRGGGGVGGGGVGGGGIKMREYDEALRKMISLAIPSTLDQLTNILIQGQQAADSNAGGLVPTDRIYMIPYLREEYPIIQQRLNLFPNYFRGQHKGVVIINIHAARTRLIFIDRRSGHQWLPNNTSVTPPPLMTYLSASRGVSCNDACHNNNGMVCYDHLLEFANDCHVMLAHFPCEQGCGHQLGLELPAYVLDGGLHTFGQCLVTDHGAPSCLTSHPSTARMCVCLPPPPSSTTNNMKKDDRPISNHQRDEEEEEEDMIDFLGPNHALMAPLQTALLNRMMRKLDRISIVLKDKEEEGRRLRQHREELGAQLYAFQQQLGSLQSNLEEANHSREDTDDKVKKVKERTEVLIEEYDSVNRNTRDQMLMLEKVREERNRVLHVVEQLKRYREDLEGNIALKKRAAYKGESNVQVVEKDKAQQDLLIDELTRALRGKNEDIALLEGQVEVQIKERDNARIMIREATQALEEINDERKVIKQEVGSNYIGLSRRDQTMQKIMESANAITADILNMETEERTLGKSISKRRELEEQLQGHVNKNKYEIAELKRLIENGGRGKEALAEEYELLSKSLMTINGDNDALEGIRKKHERECDNIEKDIQVVGRSIKAVEEAILEYIGQETTINRDTINTIKETKAMQEGNIEKEGDITEAQNESARAKVDVLNIKAHNNALADRAQELEGQLTQAEDLCRRYDEEVVRRMRQIDKRQLMVERLNKEYDDKRSGLAGIAAEEAEALGPLEAKIRGIRNEVITSSSSPPPW